MRDVFVFVVFAYPGEVVDGVFRVNARLAFQVAEVARHAEGFGVVVVRSFKGGEVLGVFDAAAYFFLDFAVQAVKLGFAGLDFSAEGDVAHVWLMNDEEFAVANAERSNFIDISDG